MIHEYSIVTADNGTEALNQIKIQKPDLVILDIMMPDMSGWKTCDQIKNDPQSRHIPVLMCSAYIEDDGKFNEYQAGDAYVQKPINLTGLLTTIQKLLDQKSRGG
jgi:CheY-like chemotaxis protein